MHDVTQSLGGAVLHFLWQGVVIGAACAVVLWVCDKRSAAVRYCVACASMGACALAFAATVILLSAGGAAAGGGGSAVAVAGRALSAFDVLSSWSGTAGVAWLWLCGVSVLVLRTCAQLSSVRRLVAASTFPPEGPWEGVFDSVRRSLGVGRAVRLLQSAAVETPMVVGWLKPVVLAPAWAFTGLTPEQFRAVVAHELAHVRRYDHLVNAVQALVETLLFFHPLVWWISRQVRVERENCCDDVAVGAAASPLVFAEALARLEALRLVYPQAALAANGGSLMERIERIIGAGGTSGARALRWKGLTALGVGCVAVAAALAQTAARDSSAVNTVQPAAVSDQPLLYMVVTTVYVPETTPEQLDQARYDNEADKIEKMVASGEMTRAEADDRYQVLKKELAERAAQRQTVEEKLSAEDEEARRVELDKLDADVKAFEDQVRQGAMTREEADARLADLKSKLACEKLARLKLDKPLGGRQKANVLLKVRLDRNEQKKQEPTKEEPKSLEPEQTPAEEETGD
jgi:beta-lactamase regulating signal transducer with metallopeptidase domain